METKRRFMVGEEWLYYKIYAGPKIAEAILVNEIYPLVEYLYSSEVISKFIFVRYFDTGYHLRLRFKMEDQNLHGYLLNMLCQKLKRYSDNRILSKCVVDVYDREIERYGGLSIEYAESIFSVDSWEILHTVKCFDAYEDRWLHGIKLMDGILNAFKLGTIEKYEFYQAYYILSSKEFEQDIETKEELKRLYRETNRSIENSLSEEYIVPAPALTTAIESIEQAATKIILLKKDNLLEMPLYNLLGSIMHMHYNRLFRIKQRKHEFVIYYLMSCYYKSLAYREEKVNTIILP